MPETQCRYCNEMHSARCPWVKALEFDPHGRVRRAEFFGALDFPPPVGWRWAPDRSRGPTFGDWDGPR